MHPNIAPLSLFLCIFDIDLIFLSFLSLPSFLSLFCPDGPRSTSIAVFPVGEVSEGRSVTLTCTSEAAPPVENFAWFKGTPQHVTMVNGVQHVLGLCVHVHVYY